MLGAHDIPYIDSAKPISCDALNTLADALYESGGGGLTRDNVLAMLIDNNVKLLVWQNYEGYLGSVDPSTFNQMAAGDRWWRGTYGDPIGTQWTGYQWNWITNSWDVLPAGLETWTVADGDIAYWSDTDAASPDERYAVFAVDTWSHSADVNPLH